MKRNLLFFAFLIKCGISFSQETEVTKETTSPATVFAGSADAYYKYDFSQVPNGYTSFTNTEDSFELGMASIEASHSWEKASVFVDLGFGSRAREFTYNDNPYTFMIKQMTFTYDVTDNFKLVAGAFGTHVGYELLDAVDNKNYSMSYAFSYGPFYNTGVKAIYTINKFGIMLGLTNPTDFKSAIESGSKNKTFIGQLSYAGDTGSVYFNVTAGSFNPITTENKTQFDLVATKQLGEKFALAFNGTYASTTDDFDSELDGEWFSLVGYASYTFKPSVLLAYRLEYFDANDATAGLGALAGSNVIGNTLSLNYKVGNLTIIPEFRIDLASEDVYVDTDLVQKGTNAYALIATTYSF